ncbi:hypothetical protein CLOM_g6416 [Closterium sp. NIES-68]|nr:hypothetical protein CLOM_g6416 [Closterium sp. NIES-68]GJP69393.1 hypothetical protein CLOP_g327 [Closterium sp. NIES-67]
MSLRNPRLSSRPLRRTFLLLSVFSAAFSAAVSAGVSENAPASAPAPSPSDEIIPDIPGIDYSVNITLPVVSGTSGDPVGPLICFEQGLSPHPVPIPCGENSSLTATSQVASLASARIASIGGSSRPLVAENSTPNLTPATELFDICTGGGSASVTLNPRRRNKWRGWGTSLCWGASGEAGLCWLGNFVGGFPDTHFNPLMDLLFSPSGLNLNIIRYNIGGGNNATNSPRLQTGWGKWRGMPGFKATEQAGYNWSADDRQRKVLFAARARGADTFEAFANSPPWWMTVSGDVAGASKYGEGNLKVQYEEAYAEFLTDVVEKFAKDTSWGEGMVFDTLEPFNEALEGWWMKGGGQEGCNIGLQQMKRILLMVQAALERKQLKTGIVSVDSFVQTTPRQIGTLNPFLARYNVHGYMSLAKNGTSSVEWTTQNFHVMKGIAKGQEKEVWVSEWGPLLRGGEDMDVALFMARSIIAAINILEATGWVFWQAIDPVASWALIHIDWSKTPDESTVYTPPTVSKKFWILKHFTSLAPAGSKRLYVNKAKCSYGIAAFYTPKKRMISVFVVNQKATPRTVKIHIPWWFLRNVGGKSKVHSWRTSYADDFVKVNYRGGHMPIRFAIPARSFASFALTHVRPLW